MFTWLMHTNQYNTVYLLVYLHGADAQAPVDDKLAEGRRPFVAVPPMDHEETA